MLTVTYEMSVEDANFGARTPVKVQSVWGFAGSRVSASEIWPSAEPTRAMAEVVWPVHVTWA